MQIQQTMVAHQALLDHQDTTHLVPIHQDLLGHLAVVHQGLLVHLDMAHREHIHQDTDHLALVRQDIGHLHLQAVTGHLCHQVATGRLLHQEDMGHMLHLAIDHLLHQASGHLALAQDTLQLVPIHQDILDHPVPAQGIGHQAQTRQDMDSAATGITHTKSTNSNIQRKN